GNQEIKVENSIARTEGGNLAGSTSTLFDCVKKAIEFGIPAADAFKMASLTPATLLGLNKGKIEAGYDAEFVVTDKDYNLLDTLIFR
ncbi:MAG: amidohydrolase family protein, partial [Clostridia bacterium]|nr:amidohydrolase family protein [Clostridia bacterium]